jgi:AraC family transcriptional regulator of adaptative response / DNA-3-methyladenine glycosylase II
MSPIPDPDTCYVAVCGRDPRFDGRFVVAVTSTGIYCRPSCPAMTPKRSNVRFFPTAAAAQLAGFRACLRCLPDAAAGSPEWNLRADLVGRAVRLIADGVIDREGVDGLARRLGYSQRQVHRQLVAELGAGPLALARAQRAQSARILIERTSMPLTDVAFAAGFASVRQFNDTIRAVFTMTPTQLRARGRHGHPAVPGAVTVRLPVRTPYDAAGLLDFLGARAVPGVETSTRTSYGRVLRLPRGTGTVLLRPGPDHVSATLRLSDLRDLTAAVQRCRRLLDADADPIAVDGALAADPALEPLVGKAPGTRVPGVVDGAELAVRAVLGQQVSVAAARTAAARVAAAYGSAVPEPDGELIVAFPSPEVLAGIDPAELPMPRARGRCLVTLCAALAAGDIDLDAGADRVAARRDLLALPGIGAWTADYIALRALGDPDAFLPTDLGVRHGARNVGLAEDEAGLTRRAEAWRPWRAYAVMHLWSAGPASATPRSPVVSRRDRGVPGADDRSGSAARPRD